MSVTVPEGLSELLEEFAVAVLREKPTDLAEFAARYFTELHMSQKGQGQGEGIRTGEQQVMMATLSELASTAEVQMDAEEEGWRGVESLCIHENIHHMRDMHISISSDEYAAASVLVQHKNTCTLCT